MTLIGRMVWDLTLSVELLTLPTGFQLELLVRTVLWLMPHAKLIVWQPAL